MLIVVVRPPRRTLTAEPGRHALAEAGRVLPSDARTLPKPQWPTAADPPARSPSRRLTVRLHAASGYMPAGAFKPMMWLWEILVIRVRNRAGQIPTTRFSSARARAGRGWRGW